MESNSKYNKCKEKNMQTKLRTYTNKGMQIVTLAERKLRH